MVGSTPSTPTCDTNVTCTPAGTPTVAYPYSLPAGATAPTATKLFNAPLGSGMGDQTVGTSNGTGWSWQTSGTSATLYNVDVSGPKCHGKLKADSAAGHRSSVACGGCVGGELSFTPPARSVRGRR